MYQKLKDKIERQNSISINVFGYENKISFICFNRVTVYSNLDVLLITENEKQHYVWIKDFDRFMFN